MSKRFLVAIATILVIGFAAFLAVYLSKGYTFSATQRRLVGTGIISVTSVPDGASVYIDGHLSSATNTSISSLTPKAYNIKLVKEGYIPWEKNVEVKEGVVAEVKATLFPALPTIYPLTVNGAITPVASPDGSKLAFAVPISSDQHIRQRGGIWVWNMNSQPLAINRGAEPHQVVISNPSLDFSKATFRWSPDSKQLLVTMEEAGNARNYLLSADQQTSIDNLKDITPMLDNTLKLWVEDEKIKNDERLATIANLKIKEIASNSAVLKWSPDETKIIVGDSLKPQVVSQKPSVSPAPQEMLKGYKVYDLLTNKSYDLPEALEYIWLASSRHIILVFEDKVSIAEFDGSNVSPIFAGKFESNAVFPWPDSSRLVVLTTFNMPTSAIANLFGINLK